MSSFQYELKMMLSSGSQNVDDVVNQGLSSNDANINRLNRPNCAYAFFAKHSSGDLHSRLKTRKILGVGETDNGDIHRSKISQLLGHNEHLYVKFPRGFRVWHFFLATLLTLQAILALLSPRHFNLLLLEESPNGPDAIFATRLSGATLLGMAIFVWNLQGTTEKSQARISLAAIITHTTIQIIVNLMWIWNEKVIVVGSPVVAYLVLRAFIALVSLFYYHAIGSSMAGLRKSASYKDLVTSTLATSPEDKKDA